MLVIEGLANQKRWPTHEIVEWEKRESERFVEVTDSATRDKAPP